jgi:hypothetical protein
MHVLVPGSWTVRRGHALSEELEGAIVEALPMATVFVHLEPLEDEASFRDQGLDRAEPGKRLGRSLILTFTKQAFRGVSRSRGGVTNPTRRVRPYVCSQSPGQTNFSELRKAEVHKLSAVPCAVDLAHKPGHRHLTSRRRPLYSFCLL